MEVAYFQYATYSALPGNAPCVYRWLVFFKQLWWFSATSRSSLHLGFIGVLQRSFRV